MVDKTVVPHCFKGKVSNDIGGQFVAVDRRKVTGSSAVGSRMLPLVVSDWVISWV